MSIMSVDQRARQHAAMLDKHVRLSISGVTMPAIAMADTPEWLMIIQIASQLEIVLVKSYKLIVN